MANAKLQLLPAYEYAEETVELFSEYTTAAFGHRRRFFFRCWNGRNGADLCLYWDCTAAWNCCYPVFPYDRENCGRKF